jgi:hypothetical protein
MPVLRDDELGAALRELEVPDHGPGFDAELERLLATPRRRRRRWVRTLAAALALLAAAGVALFLPRGSQVASAAQPRETVVDAFGSARTITGLFVSREQPRGGENRWRFVVDSRARSASPASTSRTSLPTTPRPTSRRTPTPGCSSPGPAWPRAHPTPMPPTGSSSAAWARASRPSPPKETPTSRGPSTAAARPGRCGRRPGIPARSA